MLVTRRATESDLPAIEAMVDEHVRGHPAERERRDRGRLRRAYLGERPVAHLFVAERNGGLLGMGQWTAIFDMFWGKFGGHGEWLYVRPEARGSGIGAAIIAAMFADALDYGAEFMRFSPDDEDIARLYRRVAIGGPPDFFYVSARAFREFAKLAGLPPRAVVRGLPDARLNHEP